MKEDDLKLLKINERKIVIRLLLAGFGFRILHYLLFSDYIVAGSDVMQNILLGRHLAEGNFYGVLDTYWTPLYPILIGITTYFVNSLVLPSIIISIIAGSLAVPLTYYLVKQSYGHREAIIAGILAVFFPNLINSVFALGTENLYLLWITGALIVGWRGLKKESATDFLLTGLLLGLAYLTRPEAIGYPLFFVCLIIVKNLRQKSLFKRKSLLQIGALLLGFAILSSPYIFYLRSETGHWTISGKVMKNIAAGDFENETGVTSTVSSGETCKVVVTNFILSLREVNKSLTSLLPFLLLIFAALGLFRQKWKKERLFREAYLLGFCLLTVSGYAASIVLDRYFYILLPIFFGWIACGIVELEQWFNDSLRNWLPQKSFNFQNSKVFVLFCLVVIYLYVFPVNFYVRSTDSLWQSAAFEERDAGLWLKNNGKSSPTVFSAGFRPVFYAEGKQFWMPETDTREIIKQIKDCDIDYTIVNERYFKSEPQLEEIAKSLQQDFEFKLIYQRNDQQGYAISIFALR